MILHWPQIVWLTLVLIGFGTSLEQHGKPRTGRHNVWLNLFGAGVAFWIVYSGGFFAGATP